MTPAKFISLYLVFAFDSDSCSISQRQSELLTAFDADSPHLKYLKVSIIRL